MIALLLLFIKSQLNHNTLNKYNKEVNKKLFRIITFY